MSTRSDGYFTDSSRSAALGAALELAGTYFKRSGESGLAQNGLDNTDTETASAEELLLALRLRAAIQAAATLTKAVESIERKATFRYSRRRLTSRGEIRGSLDLARLSRDVGAQRLTPEYPVVVVERGYELPENVTLFAALVLVRRELDLSREIVTHKLKEGPDFLAAQRMGECVERALVRPWLSGIRNAAASELRRGTVRTVAQAARRRIIAGHTSNPVAYKTIVDWTLRFLDGMPTSTGGDIDWSFYKAEFDETLFEIWCLTQLRIRMSEYFGGEQGDWLYGRSQPVGVFGPPAERTQFSLYTQKSLTSTVHRAPRWRSVDSSRVVVNKSLQGVPDYTVVGRDGGFVVLDAKLRDRPSRPTEEIYKLLGYFDNFAHDGPHFGVIIYYARFPRETAFEVFETESGGQILSFSVDPERAHASERGWAALRTLIQRVG